MRLGNLYTWNEITAIIGGECCIRHVDKPFTIASVMNCTVEPGVKLNCVLLIMLLEVVVESRLAFTEEGLLPIQHFWYMLATKLLRCSITSRENISASGLTSGSEMISIAHVAKPAKVATVSNRTTRITPERTRIILEQGFKWQHPAENTRIETIRMNAASAKAMPATIGLNFSMSGINITRLTPKNIPNICSKCIVVTLDMRYPKMPTKAFGQCELPR